MDECDDFLIMSMYKLIANSAENLLLLHPLLRRGGWLVTLLCRVVTWCEELPGGFHDRDHSTCEKPGKSLCFKVLKSKFCFTYRIQFRLVIHLELIGFRLITGLANLHVGVSSEAPCVIHQAKSSLPLSSLNLQLWKPNNLESPTFSSIGSNLLKVCYSILWLYSRCNCGIMNLETHCSIQTNPFCMSLFKAHFSYFLSFNQNKFYLDHDHDPGLLNDDDNGLHLIHWGALTNCGNPGPDYISIHYLFNFGYGSLGHGTLSLSEINEPFIKRVHRTDCLSQITSILWYVKQ